MRNAVIPVQDLAKSHDVHRVTITGDIKRLGIKPVVIPRGPGERGRPKIAVSAEDAKKIKARREATSTRPEYEVSTRTLKRLVAEWLWATHGRKATRVEFYVTHDGKTCGVARAARSKA